MSKYELSLSKNYVIEWNIQDALREFIQNAIDQQNTIKDNTMDINYNNNILTICNKNSKLLTKSLLLGATTKEGDKNTIGCFGEGYKIALLVLTRLNKKVTIYNYGAKEVWTSRFVKSKRYDEEILTVFVDKKYVWDKVPNNDLTIEISDITQEDYDELVNRTLQLQGDYSFIHSKRGEILSGSEHVGYIYVNGLYVTTNEDLKYGYNIKPEYLRIGRDRNLLNSFDIKVQTSKMWLEHQGEVLIGLIKDKVEDVYYITSTTDHTNIDAFEKSRETIETTADALYNSYLKDHENKNIAFVTSNDGYETITSLYSDVTPIIVDHNIKELISHSESHKKDKSNFKKNNLSKTQKYTIWKSRNSRYLDNTSIKELDEIVGV